ncbi:MAG: hypothetical protein QOI63_968 [Thermoplasmata archaeon]|nr:hypothetical protein [Thermoplasmata archaeon]
MRRTAGKALSPPSKIAVQFGGVALSQSLRKSILVITCLLMAVPMLPISSATVTPLPGSAGCTTHTSTNPRPADWYSLGEDGFYFDDACFHQFMVNAPDTAHIDVAIVPPPGPLGLRDAALLRQSVQMWEAGLKAGAHTSGMDWLRDGLTITPFVIGEDVPAGPSALVPDIIIVLGDAGPLGVAYAYAGIGTDSPLDFCHPASAAFPTIPQIQDQPGFDGHDGGGWGNLAAACGGNGQRTCIVTGAVLFDVPSPQQALNLYDLTSHEFGHCLGLGHVGDASDFQAKDYPVHDIMSYEQDGNDPAFGLCVSNLDLKTFAYRYQPFIEGAPALGYAADGAGYITMQGGSDPAPTNAVLSPLPASSWRIFRADGTLSTTAADCVQPNTGLVQLPGVPDLNGGSDPGPQGSPVATITSPAAGATGQPSSLDVSGTVDRLAGAAASGFPATDPAMTAAYTPFNAGSPFAYSSAASEATALAGDPVPKFVAGQGIDFHSRWAHSTGANALELGTPVSYFVYDTAGIQVAGPIATTASAEDTGPTSGCGTPPCFDYTGTWTSPADASGHFFFVAGAPFGGTEHYITDSNAPGPHPGLEEIEVVAPSAPAAPMASETMNGNILTPCTCLADYSGSVSWNAAFPGSPAAGTPAGVDGFWFDVSGYHGGQYSLRAGASQILGIAFFASGTDTTDVGSNVDTTMPKEGTVPSTANAAFVWHILQPNGGLGPNQPRATAFLTLDASTPVATVPGTPTALLATGGDGQVALSWSAPASDGGAAIDGYAIHYGTASGAYTQTSSASGTSKTIAGLTNGQAYFFAVAAHNSVGDSALSGEAQATPAATPPPANERVELYEGATQLGSPALVTTSSASPTASWTIPLTGLAAGSHTVTAKWFDAGVASSGTPLATASVSFSVATGTGTGTTTTSPSGTASDTGSAGGSVNNVAPAVDSLLASPSIAVQGSNAQVALTGGAHDDNGNADIAGVTVKVTDPTGASATPAATLTNDGDDATALTFAASSAVSDTSPTGTYQVDTFATDAAGLQSPVVSLTFTLLPPPAVQIGYTGAASQLDFGSFDPGASLVASQNAFRLTNALHQETRFLFDMTDFTCTRGAIPVLGNAKVLLGDMDETGTFTPRLTKDYTESTVDFGTLSDGATVFVKLELQQIPKAIAGTCTASFGLYHT